MGGLQRFTLFCVLFCMLFEGNILAEVKEKELLFQSKLKHPKIKALRSFGLLMAVQFESTDINMKIIHNCLERGLITDWFLYADDCLRIAPPLTISKEEIEKACKIILNSLEFFLAQLNLLM